MTCLAWDGLTLAGDTLCIVGDSLKIQGHKLFTLPDGRLYGGSGTYQEVLAVLAWLTQDGDKPKVETFSALLIDLDGSCVRLEDALVPLPIAEPFHAVGSGRDYALAAMALGRTAAEAVRLAMRFDPWTGGDVETLACPGTGLGGPPRGRGRYQVPTLSGNLATGPVDQGSADPGGMYAPQR